MKKRTVYIVFNVTEPRVVAVYFKRIWAEKMLSQLRSLVDSAEYRIDSLDVYDYGD